MTDAVIHQLARETAKKIWPDVSAALFSALHEEIAILEAALLHAQQVQREQIAQMIERLAAQFADDMGCISVAGVLATLRSQEIPK